MSLTLVSTKSVLSLSRIEASFSGMISTLPPSQIEVSLSFVDSEAFEYVDRVPKSAKSLVFNRESSVPSSTKDPSPALEPSANKEGEFRSVKTESDPILKMVLDQKF